MKKIGVEKKLLDHNNYYFFVLFMLLGGFFVLSFVSYSIFLQIATLAMMLFGYIILGIVHHYANHELKRKIVIEYILISAVVFTAFIFLNSGRL